MSERERLYDKEPTLIEAWNAVKRIELVIYGDATIDHEGLVEAMKTVKAFMLRWDKREYAWKVVFAALGSNLVLTVLTAVLTLVLGGGN
jgi:hypothetical protein